MFKNTVFLVFLLDIYGFFLNFFKHVQTCKDSLVHKMKAYAFDKHYSYIGLYTDDDQYVTVYNYESYSIWKLMIICLCKLFCLELTWFINLRYPKYDAIKYGVLRYYDHYEVYDFIIGKPNVYISKVGGGGDGSLNDGSLNDKPCDIDIGFVIIDGRDVTKEFMKYKHCVIANNMIVKDFANILKGLKVLETTTDYTMTILNLNTMEEQIFKANDIITL